jgi:glycosyltransferase involved in cell wall biosynthesis
MHAGAGAMSSVSVVIPCYNYGHYLEESVSSVLDDQMGVDVRVLIIDDASPDDSVEVAWKIAAREPRVEVIAHETNKGNIATFNEGLLEWADGDYTLLLSADDRLTPGALQRAVDLFDANPRVGFVYGHALWSVEGRPLPAARTKVQGWSVWPGRWWLERRFRQAENPIISPEIIVRTSVQKRVGGYDPELPRAADMEMYMRLAAHADVGFLRGVDQAYYRVHLNNMSKAVGPLLDLRQRRSVFEVVLDRYGVNLGDVARLSEAVHRTLSREALWAALRVYDRGRLRHTDVARRLLNVGAEEDEQDVAELLAFAVDCWPEIARLPQYQALLSQGGIGPRAVQYMVAHKAKWWLNRRSWRYRGF